MERGGTVGRTEFRIETYRLQDGIGEADRDRVAELLDGGEGGDTYNVDTLDIILDSGTTGTDIAIVTSNYILAPTSGIEHVLSRPSAADEKLIWDNIYEAADVVPLILEQGAQVAMNRLHTRTTPS